MRLFLAMALVAVALFFALATMLHGGGLDAAERGDFFAHDEAAHGLHALRRNRAPPAAVTTPASLKTSTSLRYWRQIASNSSAYALGSRFSRFCSTGSEYCRTFMVAKVALSPGID